MVQGVYTLLIKVVEYRSIHSFGLFCQRKDVLMIAVFVWLSFVRLGSKRSGQQILMVLVAN